MPKYKGKRFNVTLSVATFETISTLAEKETRIVSQMVVVLCEEALKARGTVIESKVE